MCVCVTHCCIMLQLHQLLERTADYSIWMNVKGSTLLWANFKYSKSTMTSLFTFPQQCHPSCHRIHFRWRCEVHTSNFADAAHLQLPGTRTHGVQNYWFLLFTAEIRLHWYHWWKIQDEWKPGTGKLSKLEFKTWEVDVDMQKSWRNKASLVKFSDQSTDPANSHWDHFGAQDPWRKGWCWQRGAHTLAPLWREHMTLIYSDWRKLAY